MFLRFLGIVVLGSGLVMEARSAVLAERLCGDGVIVVPSLSLTTSWGKWGPYLLAAMRGGSRELLSLVEKWGASPTDSSLEAEIFNNLIRASLFAWRGNPEAAAERLTLVDTSLNFVNPMIGNTMVHLVRALVNRVYSLAAASPQRQGPLGTLSRAEDHHLRAQMAMMLFLDVELSRWRIWLNQKEALAPLIGLVFDTVDMAVRDRRLSEQRRLWLFREIGPLIDQLKALTEDRLEVLRRQGSFLNIHGLPYGPLVSRAEEILAQVWELTSFPTGESGRSH